MTDLLNVPSKRVEGRSTFFAIAAFTTTWMLSAWRVSPSGAWAGDYATIRAMSGTAFDAEGFVSAVLCWLFRHVPLGTPVQRLSIVSAFGAAWAAWFAYQLAHQFLDRDPPQSRARCWLALGASLLFSLGTTAQCSATQPNGSTVAVAAGLACIWLLGRLIGDRSRSQLLPDAEDSQLRHAFVMGGVVAVTCLESHRVGLLSIVVGLIYIASGRSIPSRSVRTSLLLGFGAPYLAVGLPWWFARRGLAAASVEHPLLTSLSTLRPFSDYAARLGQMVTMVGPIWFALAVAGLVLLLLRRERRASAWIFATLGVAFVSMPVQTAAAGNRGEDVALIGAMVLSLTATSGLRDIIHWATIRKPNAATLATTLAVLAQVVTVLARSEEATYALEQRQNLGAEVWTDEALAVLPARAIVLARTQPIIERIHAAQLAEGMRPDVLVVPLERATDPHIVALLLSAEPNLTALLRDLAISGRPSENSMSGLADVRPLFVEFDGSWDPRLREHLLVQPFFHRVLSQTLGRSDRAAVVPDGQRAVARLLDVLERDTPGVGHASVQASDGSFTRAIVDLRLREQLTLLLALGDRQSFDTLAIEYDRAFAGGKWLGRLRQRLGATNRGAVDAFDLLDERNATTQGKTTPVPLRKQG